MQEAANRRTFYRSRLERRSPGQRSRRYKPDCFSIVLECGNRQEDKRRECCALFESARGNPQSVLGRSLWPFQLWLSRRFVKSCLAIRHWRQREIIPGCPFEHSTGEL